ncbi:MAG: hypothetical protein QM619_16740 [Micropruina sp.]|uniref:hypothetical protein n=1 Tax=Micropruina sp. TaxID=2737536 RepID=UPI0039E5BFBD
MSKTTRFFQDVLTIDAGVPAALQASGGDTLVLAGRLVTLTGLVSGFNYVIAADQLTVADDAALSVFGVTGPSIGVFAREILGAPLAITSTGADGADGAPGEPGESGIVRPGEGSQDPQHGIDDGGPGRPPHMGGGRPVLLPGGDGGPGGDGDNGGNGGDITVRYHHAEHPPTGASIGGRAGRAGAPGAGGPGRPPGRRGPRGEPGHSGRPGVIDIAEVPEDEIWTALGAEPLREWAAYRASIAEYFFRRFDPASQLFALSEAAAALALNPTDPTALTVRERIANRQTPSGLSRDLDIAPDFRALSANLAAEIAVVQNAFQAYVSVVSLETIAESIRDNLRLMENQLQDRRAEAQADVSLAEQDVRIAEAEISNIDLQIKDLDDQIETIREERFSIAGILADVGSIVGVIAGMATGLGAIFSVAGGLATLQRVADGVDLVQLLKWLKEKPDPNSPRSEDIEEIKELGGGFKDLIEGTKSAISFGKVMKDLEDAMSLPGQDAIGKLVKQQILLTREKMVGQLRQRQAIGRVLATQLRVANLDGEIAQVQATLANWSADAEALKAATDLLIRAAREVVDMVMEDVFLAQRAREIYQLDRLTDLRFDFGYLHPDADRSLSPAQRAAASLTSLSGMAIQVLAWDQIFTQLNTAQLGFDVIHPQLSVAITEPGALAGFAAGGALEFGIGLDAVPEKMFELKVSAMTLDLVGASASQSSNVWVTHSGTWSMNRRAGDGVTDLVLLPRSELFAFSAGAGTLIAKIPANPSPVEPGPPFSFWGRGAATTFRLQLAQPSALDLSGLSAVRVRIDCIGYARQGAGGTTDAQVRAEVGSGRALAVHPSRIA